MELREEFVLRGTVSGANIAELCREYRISRKTGYKWLARYKERGLAGVEELSRRPGRNPLRVSGEMVARVVALRVEHPKWGARKLVLVLRREVVGEKAPGERTISRILERAGMLQPVRRRKRHPSNGPSKAPKAVVKAPNDLWTVDFKGWWLAISGERCEPLTIRDAHSRYVIEIAVLAKNSYASVREVFERVFRRYGMPRAILTDNGPPFVASSGDVGLTRLSVWWLSLNIEHLRSRPATPSDNGGHERMHKDMAAELEEFAELTRERQQVACERWRSEFNNRRPHEALGMRTPADVYRRSEVRFTGKPVDVSYPADFYVRTVSKRGHINHKHRPAFLSLALTKHQVGLERKDRDLFDVWFGHHKIGRVDFTKSPAKLTPERWIDNTVSPMGA